MRENLKRQWRTGLVALLAPLALSACGHAGPALIADATAKGGIFWVCPTRAFGATTVPTALSPEFDGRLKTRFPPGTPEPELTSELKEQGFTLEGACAGDPSIRSASYFDGGGALGGGVLAIAAWKVDDQNRIVWTRGNIQYDGL